VVRPRHYRLIPVYTNRIKKGEIFQLTLFNSFSVENAFFGSCILCYARWQETSPWNLTIYDKNLIIEVDKPSLPYIYIPPTIHSGLHHGTVNDSVELHGP
jgi:hypothetical protein